MNKFRGFIMMNFANSKERIDEAMHSNDLLFPEGFKLRMRDSYIGSTGTFRSQSIFNARTK